jgi:single-strand DNA-binding protein
MKNITIAGGVTRDSELRTAGQNGDKVLGFSVAVSEGFGDKKRTLYFDCSFWGKRGETLHSMLTKGAKVCVSGEFSTREHDGKSYNTIRANDVTLMGGKPQGDAGGYDKPAGGAGYGAGGGPNSGGMDDMDSIPFAASVL